MADEEKNSSSGEIEQVEEIQRDETKSAVPERKPSVGGSDGGGGWGGWGFSPLSYLSDLQKAATVAAEEISRNAAEVAKTAAKSIADLNPDDVESESSKDGDAEESAVDDDENNDEDDKRRKSALEKLEKASEDTFLGQGLKVLDNSVENLASGAWQAIGSAWKGGSELVHKLENSAVNFAESVQNGGLPVAAGSVAPSLLESGKAFTAKGMQVLELVGKETMDLLISETGIKVDRYGRSIEGNKMDFEEVTFDRCFYIYGGPEQLEELEALSNHYTLLFNRRKTKLKPEQKTVYDGKFKQIQQIFDLSCEIIDGSLIDSEKGKEVDAGTENAIKEMKMLQDSSFSKAAELAAGFASALAGVAPNDIIQRTTGRLESLHSEGVHRLSEMCCFAVTHLFMLGKSVTSNVNKGEEMQDIDDDDDDEIIKIDWPEDCVEKAKIIRAKTRTMTRNVDAVYHSFVTGISDVAEAYLAAMKGAASSDSANVYPQNSIQKKADEFSENLRADHITALGKIQDGLQYLSYLVLSTSVPSTV